MTLTINRQFTVNNNLVNKKDNTSFKGAEALITALTFIQNNEVAEKAGVDLVSMVIPRTLIDTSRNIYAGVETLTREISGTILNCFAPGIMAGVIGLAFGKQGLKKIWANTNTIETMKAAWEQVSKSPKGVADEATVSNFVDTIFKNLKGLDGNKWKSALEAQPEEIQKAKNVLVELIRDSENKLNTKEKLEEAVRSIGNAFGARQNLKLSIENNILHTTAEDLVRDATDLGKNIFAKAGEEIAPKLKSLASLTRNKALISLLVVGGLSFSTQYINRYLTKKRTGSSDFVGYKDFGGQNPAMTGKKSSTEKIKFYLQKAGAIGLISGIAVASMGGLKGGLQGMMRRLEFRSSSPNLNQLKFVYGLTIVGRLLAARVPDELRETTFRDSLGFANWLILGGVVTKFIAGKLDPRLINIKEPLANAGTLDKFIHWVSAHSVKSYAEIDAMQGLTEAAKNALKGSLSKSILGGMAYSCIALGIVVPFLNKIMTDSARTKQLQKLAENINNLLSNPVIKVNTFNPFLGNLPGYGNNARSKNS